MKKYLLLSAVVTVVLFACLSTGSDPNPTTVDDFSDYVSWSKVNATTVTGDRRGDLGMAHGGQKGFREIYVNAAGKAVSAGQADLPYPMGTILVKETYKRSGGQKGDLRGLTVMIKREAGYDADNDNWEYLNVSKSLKIKSQGRINLCIKCHSIAFMDDYVFTSNR